MESKIKTLSYKINQIKEKVDFFEYSQKTDQELILVIKKFIFLKGLNIIRMNIFVKQ